MTKEGRREFLSLFGTSARLRYLLKLLLELKNNKVVVCLDCGVGLAKFSDVIVISDQRLHVNQHGVLHNLLTVSSAQNCNLQGQPTEEHSYFRQYAWTILECANGHHVGWKYTATHPSVQPESFVGLSRNAINLI